MRMDGCLPLCVCLCVGGCVGVRGRERKSARGREGERKIRIE